MGEAGRESLGFLKRDVLGLGPTFISRTGIGEQAFEACNVSCNELLSNLSETKTSFECWVDSSHSCIRDLSTHLVSVHCRSAKSRGSDLSLWCFSRVVPGKGVLRLCLYYRQVLHGDIRVSPVQAELDCQL